jgi:hypothetical protein
MLSQDYRMVSLAQQILNNIPSFPKWNKETRKNAFALLVNFGAVDFVMQDLRRYEYIYRFDSYMSACDASNDQDFVNVSHEAYYLMKALAVAEDNYTFALDNVLKFQQKNDESAKALWNIANKVFFDCHTKGMNEYFRNVSKAAITPEQPNVDERKQEVDELLQKAYWRDA